MGIQMYDGKGLVMADVYTFRTTAGFHEVAFPDDMGVEDVCGIVYEVWGQEVVHQLVATHLPKQPWGYCRPCEIESPITSDYARCLVCGSGEVTV